MNIFHIDGTLIIPIELWKAHPWEHEVIEDITEAKERVDIAFLWHVNQVISHSARVRK